jgi:SAM-dependent methyltransferase
LLTEPKLPAHLKSIQDVLAMSYLKDLEGCDIVEIGGGTTRILPHLATKNRCVNMDRCDGSDGGATAPPEIEGVKTIQCFLGADSDEVSSEQFDAAFSVSVVEHVPKSSLESFFAEQHRITKPGALCLHLIDAYLVDGDNPGFVNLMEHYLKPFREGLYQSIDPDFDATAPEVIRFSTAYATNPDPIMRLWNRWGPALRTIRETGQSVALIWAGKRI